MNPAENWQTAATEPEAPPAFAPRPVSSAIPSPVGHKNPILAAVLSLFPGIGNVYNGLYMRGVTFFLVIACLIGHHGRRASIRCSGWRSPSSGSST